MTKQKVTIQKAIQILKELIEEKENEQTERT